eukprot:15362801-Ditylum_brightwellii.AAC.1
MKNKNMFEATEWFIFQHRRIIQVVVVMVHLGTLQMRDFRESLRIKENGEIIMESLAAIAKLQPYGGCTEIWQMCNKCGFYQACKHDLSCPYEKGYHSIEKCLEICNVAFEVPSEEVEATVEKLLQYYRGWDMNGSHIMLVNGDANPWAELSITRDKGSEDMPTVWMKWASHHLCTYTLKIMDGEATKNTKLVIHDQVMEWFIEEDEKSDNEVYKNASTQLFDVVEPLAESYMME